MRASLNACASSIIRVTTIGGAECVALASQLPLGGEIQIST
jgi:hypothetical protein